LRRTRASFRWHATWGERRDAAASPPVPACVVRAWSSDRHKWSAQRRHESARHRPTRDGCTVARWWCAASSSPAGPRGRGPRQRDRFGVPREEPAPPGRRPLSRCALQRVHQRRNDDALHPRRKSGRLRTYSRAPRIPSRRLEVRSRSSGPRHRFATTSSRGRRVPLAGVCGVPRWATHGFRVELIQSVEEIRVRFGPEGVKRTAPRRSTSAAVLSRARYRVDRNEPCRRRRFETVRCLR
jgi:hypothetical protein